MKTEKEIKPTPGVRTLTDKIQICKVYLNAAINKLIADIHRYQKKLKELESHDAGFQFLHEVYTAMIDFTQEYLDGYNNHLEKIHRFEITRSELLNSSLAI